MRKALLTSLLLTLAIVAHAQPEGVHQIFAGGLATFASGATNTWTVGANTYTAGWPGTLTNLAQSVSEYDDAGVTFSFTAPGGTTGAATVAVYRSYDAGNSGGSNPVYEQNPGFVFTLTPSGAGTYTTNANLHLPGVSSIAFVVSNNVSASITGGLLEVNLKMPKRGALQATK